MESKQKATQELDSYYDNEYSNMMNLEPIDRISQVFIRSFSHSIRFQKQARELEYTFTQPKSNVITTCFTVGSGENTCIYAYLYSQCTGMLEPLDENGRSTDNNFAHMFFATGSTFNSQDGEYRSRVLPYFRLQEILDAYRDIFDAVEQIVLDEFNEAKIHFHSDFYFPPQCQVRARDFSETIDNLRLPIKLFMIAIAHDAYLKSLGMLENHLNQIYRNILDELPTDPVVKMITTDGGYRFLHDLTCLEPELKHATKLRPQHGLRCGQKLVPLSVYEARLPDNILFGFWREIMAGALASKLVVNLICPSFPLTGNWFYVHGIRPELFDNAAMHEKFAQSEISAEISKRLREVDRMNYIDGDRQRGPLSGKFLKLSRGLYKSIHYNDSEIHISRLAAGVFSEYVGRTLRDVPTLTDQVVSRNVLAMFSRADMFRKHIFEFAYACYCMNTRVGMMHGDLHMNNATVFSHYNVTEKMQKMMPNARVAYKFDNSWYVFPHLGAFSCIIDFSRALFNHTADISARWGDTFAEMFYADQSERVLYTLNHYFPRLVTKHKDKLGDHIKHRLDLVFKIMTALDLYSVLGGIQAMIAINPGATTPNAASTSEPTTPGFIVAPEVRKMTDEMFGRIEQIFTTHISALISGKLTSPGAIQWPCAQFITETFAAEKTIPGAGKPPAIVTPDAIQASEPILVDVFRADNPLKYDLESYDNYNPLIKLDKRHEVFAKYNIPLPQEDRDLERMQHIDESKQRADLVREYEPEVVYDPWMLM